MKQKKNEYIKLDQHMVQAKKKMKFTNTLISSNTVFEIEVGT